MYMAADELASQFHGIRESVPKLREAITKGFFQEALVLVTQVNSSTGQLAAELARFSK